MELSWFTIDRRDIPKIWAAVDWADGRQLYLSTKDLGAAAGIPVNRINESCAEGAWVDTYGITFVKAEAAMGLLAAVNTELSKKICWWLEHDILPSVKIMVNAVNL